jgi:TPP-dependent pyruvate/acetoin dehydrogenase alpha subunit
MSRKDILRNTIFLRLGQLLVNEMYKANKLKVPIHLAFGHESIAVAVNQVIQDVDQLVLSHRNIHYNMVRESRVNLEIDEYMLKDTGLAKGKLGSMNLVNPNKNIVYTSNILGNNLPVSSGISLSNMIQKINGVVFTVTGDGAIEEGSFYESLLLMKSMSLSNIVIVENNNWSLATQIHERRSEIDLQKISSGLGVKYILLKGNNIFEYIDILKEARNHAEKHKSPVCIEVILTTLGDWRMEKDGYPEGKFINYHAGPAPTLDIHKSLVITESNKDPLHVILSQFPESEVQNIVHEFYTNLPSGLIQ